MSTKVAQISFFAALLFALSPATIRCQEAETAARNLAKRRVETADRELREAIAVSKPSDDKNWFSQFLFAFPSGGTGTVGFNRTLYKRDPSKQGPLGQVNFEFKFGKGGGEKADPRFLDVGLNFRKILFGPKRSMALKTLRISAPPSLLAAVEVDTFRSNAARVIREVEDLNRPEWFLNYASLHFETDLNKLKPGPVNNLLFSPSLEVRSRLMAIGNGCRQSESSSSESEGEKECLPGPFFWSYRFVPLGAEIAKNLRNKDNRGLQGNLISRLRANTNLKLFYESPCRYNTWFAGIMLEGDLTDRYLLTKESRFDRITGLSNLIARDNQYSLQIDLKFITGLKLPEDLALIKPLKKLNWPKLGRRPSLTFSYRRGVVPPVFAFYDKFRVGLTFESLDDDNSQDLGHVLPSRK